jgi:choice-of-anchor B domain-containing protein
MRLVFFIAMVLPYITTAQPSANMTLLSTYDDASLPTRFSIEYSDCWGYRHANGTEVAIIGGIEDILFVDITIPADPVLILKYHVHNSPSGTVNASAWRDFMTYDNYVYAAADEGTSGLLIFDMSQLPDTVTMVSQTVAFWNRTHTIFIDEPNGKLYAGGSNSVNNGLVILDLTANPTLPTLAANVPLNTVGGGYVHDMFVRDNIAWCSHGSLSKIQMYDFSALPSFTVIGSIENYPEPGYNHSSWLNDDGTMLVMCDETHGSDVKLVDVTDPGDISSDDFYTFYSELLGPNAPGASVAHNPFILGDMAYIAYYHDGVQVFYIGNPNNIELVAYYDTYPDNVDYNGYKGCWGVYPYLPSGVIVASDMNYGLYMMSITNPPLDITFLSFDAYRVGKVVQLEWTVADVASGNQFEVMRSSDNGQTFQSIGNVTMNPAKSTYQFTDDHIAGSSRYTYRIDFIEDDGHHLSSPLRLVRTLSGQQAFRVVNPVTSTLTIDVLKPAEFVSLSLYNIEGKSVWAQKVSAPGTRIELELGDIPAGQYVLTINAETGSENLILQKAR